MKPNLLPRGNAPGFDKLPPKDGVFRCVLKPVRKRHRESFREGIICKRVTVPGVRVRDSRALDPGGDSLARPSWPRVSGFRFQKSRG